MVQVSTETGRVQELVSEIYQRSGKQHLLYKELITLASADELGSQYAERDFNVYFQEGELTLEEQVHIINKGYYREFSNLVGISGLPVHSSIDTCRILDGLVRFIDCKLIPWIEVDTYHENRDFYYLYIKIIREFTDLNGLYLGKEQRVGDLIKRVQGLLGGLHLQTSK